ncbi:hypothetical protein JHK82_012057 [Glycine max]|nr:hypothetical protein JHK85_012378 [Glycine max]KAG5057053.1 hypothetical protein JHK86_012049 [Glycine max]KAG5154088.1 hypothetical protein JHK82_012057 [Glycine max]
MPNFASLKSHAVTLYEAGKLGYGSIADLCKDLSTLECATYEGELQEFANHLFSLHCVLECLQSGEIVTNIKEEGSSDKLSMITSSNDGQSSEIAESSLKLVEASIYTDHVSSGMDDETSHSPFPLVSHSPSPLPFLTLHYSFSAVVASEDYGSKMLTTTTTMMFSSILWFSLYDLG